MRLVRAFYALGVASASASGFFSPLWFLGFLPIALGLVWAAYDLVEVTDAESPSAPQ